MPKQKIPLKNEKFRTVNVEKLKLKALPHLPKNRERLSYWNVRRIKGEFGTGF